MIHVKRLVSLYGTNECLLWCYLAVCWIDLSLRSVNPIFGDNSNLVLDAFLNFFRSHPDINLLDCTTKSVCNLFLNQVRTPPKIVDLFPNIDFNCVGGNISASIRANNVRDFLFKLTHRVLYTGDFLLRISRGTVRTRCYFCESVPESVPHLFFFL